MQQNIESNLYIACCTCRCASTCIYKGILLLECIMYALSFANSIKDLATLGVNQMTVGIAVYSLIMLYVCYISGMLYLNFNQNLADGSLNAKTKSYLVPRRIMIWVQVVIGCIMAVFVFVLVAVLGVAIGSSGQSSDDDQKKAAAGAMALGAILGGVILLIVLLFGWMSFRYVKSVEEAALALSGCVNQSQESLAKNQVV